MMQLILASTISVGVIATIIFVVIVVLCCIAWSCSSKPEESDGDSLGLRPALPSHYEDSPPPSIAISAVEHGDEVVPVVVTLPAEHLHELHALVTKIKRNHHKKGATGNEKHRLDLAKKHKRRKP